MVSEGKCSWGLSHFFEKSFPYCHCQVTDLDLMNKINPQKLLNSKWTAVTPSNKEKHFIVSEIEFDEEGQVVFCSIEAVMSKRAAPINWHDLKDDNNWVHGWK